MAKVSLGDLIGGWAFLIGVILAIVIGFFPAVNTSAMITTLVVIGVIIGLLNVADKEAMPFLISGLVLVLVSSIGTGAMASLPVLARILSALVTIFIPATLIVAVKNVLSLGMR